MDNDLGLIPMGNTAVADKPKDDDLGLVPMSNKDLGNGITQGADGHVYKPDMADDKSKVGKNFDDDLGLVPDHKTSAHQEMASLFAEDNKQNPIVSKDMEDQALKNRMADNPNGELTQGPKEEWYSPAQRSITDAGSAFEAHMNKKSPIGIGERIANPSQDTLTDQQKLQSQEHPVAAFLGDVAGSISTFGTAAALAPESAVAFAAANVLTGVADQADHVKDANAKMTSASLWGGAVVDAVTGKFMGDAFLRSSAGNTILDRTIEQGAQVGEQAFKQVIGHQVVEGRPIDVKEAAVSAGQQMLALGVLKAMVDIPQLRSLATNEAKAQLSPNGIFLSSNGPIKFDLNNLTMQDVQKILADRNINPETLSPEYKQAKYEINRKIAIEGLNSKASQYGIPNDVMLDVLNQKDAIARGQVLTQWMAGKLKATTNIPGADAVSKAGMEQISKLAPFLDAIKKGADPIEILQMHDILQKFHASQQMEEGVSVKGQTEGKAPMSTEEGEKVPFLQDNKGQKYTIGEPNEEIPQGTKEQPAAQSSKAPEGNTIPVNEENPKTGASSIKGPVVAGTQGTTGQGGQGTAQVGIKSPIVSPGVSSSKPEESSKASEEGQVSSNQEDRKIGSVVDHGNGIKSVVLTPEQIKKLGHLRTIGGSAIDGNSLIQSWKVSISDFNAEKAGIKPTDKVVILSSDHANNPDVLQHELNHHELDSLSEDDKKIFNDNVDKILNNSNHDMQAEIDDLKSQGYSGWQLGHELYARGFVDKTGKEIKGWNRGQVVGKKSSPAIATTEELGIKPKLDLTPLEEPKDIPGEVISTTAGGHKIVSQRDPKGVIRSYEKLIGKTQDKWDDKDLKAVLNGGDAVLKNVTPSLTGDRVKQSAWKDFSKKQDEDFTIAGSEKMLSAVRTRKLTSYWKANDERMQSLASDKGGQYASDGRFLIIDKTIAENMRNEFWANHKGKEARKADVTHPNYEAVIPKSSDATTPADFVGLGVFNSDNERITNAIFFDGKAYHYFDAEYYNAIKKVLPDAKPFLENKYTLPNMIFKVGDKIKAILLHRIGRDVQGDPFALKGVQSQTEKLNTTEAGKITTTLADQLGQRVGDWHKEFGEAVVNKDAEKIVSWIATGAGHNETTKKVFSQVTGVKLPSTIEGKKEAIYKWAGKEQPAPVEKPAEAPKMSKEEVFKKMQEGKADKSLDVKVSYDGQVMTRRKFVENKVKQPGIVAETKVSKDDKAIEKLFAERRDLGRNGMQNINAKKIEELNKKIAEGVNKTEYRIVNPDGSFNIVTKAEHDYFNKIKDEKDLGLVKDHEQELKNIVAEVKESVLNQGQPMFKLLPTWAQLSQNPILLKKANEAGYRYIESILGKKVADSISNPGVIFTKDGQKAWGQYYKGKMQVVNGEGVDTYIHEAGHFVLDMFCTKAERDSLISKAHTIWEGLDDRQVEEQIMENLTKYAADHGYIPENGIWGEIKAFFRRIEHRIKTWLGSDPNAFHQFYSNILTGKYKDAPQLKDWNEMGDQIMYAQQSNAPQEYKGPAIYDPAIEAVAKSYKEIQAMVAPRTLVPRDALDMIMKMKGDRDKLEFILETKLLKLEKAFGKMPKEDQIAFVDNIKTGNPQATPVLQAVADMMRTIEDKYWAHAKEFKPSLAYKENHYRVMWKVIPGSDEAKGGFHGLFKRPFQGTQGWAKKSTLADMSEGIKAGGVPYSFNPITMWKNSIMDMQKFTTARRMWNNLNEMGYVKFVRPGKSAPSGYVIVDDKISHVYLPIEAKIGEGEPFDASLEMGKYFVEPGSGRILNNMLGRDTIRESTLGGGLLAFKNLTTGIELSISPFHAAYVSLMASSSSMGLGLQKIANRGFIMADPKAFLDGLKDIGTGMVPLAAPAHLYKIGSAAIKYLSGEEFASTKEVKDFVKAFPEAAALLDDLFTGGGKLAIHQDYKINALKAMELGIRDFRDSKNSYMVAQASGDTAGMKKYALEMSKNAFGEVFHLLPGLNQIVMRPLFEVYIPRLKIGSFLKEYSNDLVARKDQLDSGRITRSQLARETWDSVERRFGEMNFDNLFWNRNMKTSLQILFRSVTWKYGALQNIGGAGTGTIKDIAIAVKDKTLPKLNRNMAALLGLLLMVTVFAEVMQKLLTDKHLGQKDDGGFDLGLMFKDSLDPRYNKNGDRLFFNTHLKDWAHLFHSPGGFLSNSLSGMFGRAMEDYKNKDFFNTQIYNPRDPWYKQDFDMLKHMIPLPFMITNQQQLKVKNAPDAIKALTAAGFTTPAPGYVNDTPVMSLAKEILANKPYNQVVKTQDQAAESKKVMELKANYNATKDAGPLKEAEKKGVITFDQYLKIKQDANKTPLVKMAESKSMKFDDIAQLMDKAVETKSVDEQNALWPILREKYFNGINRWHADEAKQNTAVYKDIRAKIGK